MAMRSGWRVKVSGRWLTDEVPNHQVLERRPIRRAIPGSIEQQEFEYKRHGTVNLLFFLIVHTGRMEVVVEAKKDAGALHQGTGKRFVAGTEGWKRVFLIQDNDPKSHGRQYGGILVWLRLVASSRFTPPHASWLNQAESWFEAFAYYYLKHSGSWNSRGKSSSNM